MDDKKPTLEDAEAALKRLEKPTHDLDLANMGLRAAELTGDTAKIREALGVYRAALDAKEASNISQSDIDAAAELVLELRGEAHEETNVLPPDHGLATVLAGRALAMAQGELTLSPNNARLKVNLAAAQKDFDEAEASDAAAKRLHSIEGHQRTLALLAEGEK